VKKSDLPEGHIPDRPVRGTHGTEYVISHYVGEPDDPGYRTVSFIAPPASGPRNVVHIPWPDIVRLVADEIRMQRTAALHQAHDNDIVGIEDPA
jgi:hypothetical protein